LNLPLPLLLLFEGFLFTAFFGSFSWLRREGLPGQFAVEAIAITLVISGMSAVTGYPIDPLLFLVVLYLLTLRVRLLLDLANIFAAHRNFSIADRLYRYAGHLWPDPEGRLMIRINQVALRLQQGSLEEAIAGLKELIQQIKRDGMGIRFASAVHYNLGIAYRLKRLETQAVSEFNTVLETWPASEYARRAASALSGDHQNPEE
jgi:tetratricopeptide (TPR) repeat protein